MARTDVNNRLIVFVKAPRPGQVKTRLANTIGAGAAASAYRKMVETLFAALAPLQPVEVRFAPDDAHEELQPWLHAGWICTPQGPGDLGERLTRAFRDGFQGGLKRVVIIGSDCPTVTPRDIRAAWDALEKFDVVLGPAVDGGYWLIGLRQEHPELFRGVPWSSDEVLTTTLQLATETRLTVFQLEVKRDVDTEVEWRAYCATKTGEQTRPGDNRAPTAN